MSATSSTPSRIGTRTPNCAFTAGGAPLSTPESPTNNVAITRVAALRPTVAVMVLRNTAVPPRLATNTLRAASELDAHSQLDRARAIVSCHRFVLRRDDAKTLGRRQVQSRVLEFHAVQDVEEVEGDAERHRAGQSRLLAQR